jgi:hypothetical protein
MIRKIIKNWLFKEDLNELSEIKRKLKNQQYIQNVKCDCKNLQELHYFYDDDWHHIGCNVYTEYNHSVPFGRLMYCPKCKTVKVVLNSK